MKDVQNQQDFRGVDIQKVGIKDFEMPIIIQRKEAEDKVIYASATCGVSLPAHFKGTHMSRFVEVLNNWRGKKTLDIKDCVESMVQRLDAESGYVKFDFKYFVDKKSPVTGISAPMCYDCTFEGILDNYKKDDEKYRFYLGAKVPVTTLCPCSKEISEYGAHNQRAIISVKVTYAENEHVWLEDLISDIEKTASSELYPLLKREDEKYVTEHAYNNPKFVEDVLRDVVILLRNNDKIKSFEVECESLESIHNHSAWCATHVDIWRTKK
ncbi:GTP cyclohydrolase I FolE2 [bacterium]|nr:GTP cyclohydrolase I FolE2 [bacterium]